MIYSGRIRHIIQDELAKLAYWDVIGEEYYKGGGRRGFSEKWVNVANKTNIILKRYLSKLDIPVNVYFINDRKFIEGISMREGPILKSRVMKAADKLGYKDRLKDGKGALNILLLGFGEVEKESGNIPPTPWIVIHWIAHGVMNFRNDAYGKIGDMFRDVIEELYGHRFSFLDAAGKDFITGIGTFGAARRKKIRNAWEGVHDIFTQYIKNGSITFNKPPERLFTSVGYISLKKSRNKTVMKKLKKDLESFFDYALNQSKGMWFVI